MNFSEKCYLLLKKVPKGKVVTYKEIARKLGSKGYRTVGNILNKNRNLIKIPCHRVIRSDGKIGNYVLGNKKKIELLKKEGIEIIDGKVDLKKYEYKFGLL